MTATTSQAALLETSDDWGMVMISRTHCFKHCRRTGGRGLKLALGFAALLWIAGAMAQDYPTRPVRIVVPYAPGGVADIVARIVGEKLHGRLSQPVVVLNKEGAGTIIGTDFVAKSTPDGYTLLLASTAIAMNAALGRKLPYDLVKDLAPVSTVFVQPNVLVVMLSLPVKSVAELVSYAKSHPGELRFGSSGVGAVIHLYTELFAASAGVKLSHVPYKGVAPAMVGLLAGEIDMMFSGITNAAPQVKAAKLRALAITSRQRSAILPEVVPLAEQGLPDFDVTTWYGIFTRNGAPGKIVARLHEELKAVTGMTDVKERFASQGGEARSVAPGEFAALVGRELKTWERIVRSANIKVD